MIDLYIKLLLIIIGWSAIDKLKHEKRKDGILLGRSFPFKKVYWDHKRYFHLIITGVTNAGKSVLCENIVRGRNTVLINTWESDFKSIPEARRINDKDSIISFFKCLPNNTEEVFIVVDELATLMQDKEIAKEINNACMFARHYNAHIIGITPRVLSSEINCKSLFPARITGRLLQESDYRTALGISINVNLGMREFIIIQDRMEVFRSETNRKYLNT
jgi:hypothetical protein